MRNPNYITQPTPETHYELPGGGYRLKPGAHSRTIGRQAVLRDFARDRVGACSAVPKFLTRSLQLAACHGGEGLPVGSAMHRIGLYVLRRFEPIDAPAWWIDCYMTREWDGRDMRRFASVMVELGFPWPIKPGLSDVERYLAARMIEDLNLEGLRGLADIFGGCVVEPSPEVLSTMSPEQIETYIA